MFIKFLFLKILIVIASVNAQSTSPLEVAETPVYSPGIICYADAENAVETTQRAENAIANNVPENEVEIPVLETETEIENGEWVSVYVYETEILWDDPDTVVVACDDGYNIWEFYADNDGYYEPGMDIEIYIENGEVIDFQA